MLHVDELAVSDEAGGVVGAGFRVVLGIVLLRKAEQIGKEVGAEQRQLADWQVGEVVEVVMKERRRREGNRFRRGGIFEKEMAERDKGLPRPRERPVFGDFALNSSSTIAH